MNLQAYLLEHEQRDDQSINTQDTSHDNWNDWLEDEFWFEDTHWGDTDSTLSSSVRSSQVYIQTSQLNLFTEVDEI